MLFPILVNLRTCIDDSKVWFKVFDLLLTSRSNKHISYEMLLPCHFVNKSHFFLSLSVEIQIEHWKWKGGELKSILNCSTNTVQANATNLWIGTTKAVKNVGFFFATEIVHSFFVQFVEDLRSCRLVDRTPINVGLAFTALIEYNPLILGRSTCKFSSVHRESFSELCCSNFTFSIGNFVFKEFLKGQVVVKSCRTINSKRCKV